MDNLENDVESTKTLTNERTTEDNSFYYFERDRNYAE